MFSVPIKAAQLRSTVPLWGLKCDSHSECSGFYKTIEVDRAWALEDVSVNAVVKEGSGDSIGWESEVFEAKTTPGTWSRITQELEKQKYRIILHLSFLI